MASQIVIILTELQSCKQLIQSVLKGDLTAERLQQVTTTGAIGGNPISEKPVSVTPAMTKSPIDTHDKDLSKINS